MRSIAYHVRVLFVALAVVASASGQAKWRHLQGGLYEGVAFLDADRGWIAGDTRIHFTTNGGFDNWPEAEIINAEENEEIRVHLRGLFLDDDSMTVSGWAVGSGGVVLVTDPSDLTGQTWLDANPENRVLNACGEPAVLYDIFMLDALNGWVVGERGAIAVTADGGETWTNVVESKAGLGSFSCGPVTHDAYIVHFFANDPQVGIIASEYRRIYTTVDGGDTWTEIEVTSDNGGTPCPPIDFSRGHIAPQNNLEWWGMDFDDPADPAAPMWLVGGIGFNSGYAYRSGGMVSGSWQNTWEQVKRYQFDVEVPLSTLHVVCGPSTRYGVTVLDPTVDRVVNVGYGSQVFEYEQAVDNFDSCLCDVVSGTLGDTWVHKLLPEIDEDAGHPFLRASAKVDANTVCTVGAFGRIARYDATSDEATDVGTVVPNRILDASFIDANVGCVVGQGQAVHYTEDGGESWARPDMDWDFDGALQANAIAFDSSGTRGICVGDYGFIARTDNAAAPANQPWRAWTVDVTKHGHVSTLHDVVFAAAATGCAEPGTAYAIGGAGGVGYVYKSEDNGETWHNTLSLFPGMDTETLRAISFATPCSGYAVGDNNLIYRTEDGCQTWQQVPTSGGSGENFHDVQTWGDGSAAIVVGQNGGVFAKGSTDTHFVKQDLQLGGVAPRQHLYDVEVLGSGSEVWVAGEDGLMLHRDTNGTWAKRRSGTTFPLTKIDFVGADEAFAIGWMFLVLKYDDQ